ncbi:MAG: hypothetical protein MUP02_06710 [Actinobacteria bacterium]|nr:hypothetical protein [Actinomycetota bacterium]
MKKALILTITILSIIGLFLFTGCWSDAVKAIAPDEAMMLEDLEETAKDPEDSEMNKSNLSGTLIFDNSNSELGCFISALIPYQVKLNSEEYYEKLMILTTSTSQMEEDSTQFNITFDFNQGIITGFFDGDYYSQEEKEAFDSAEIDANITNGTVTWDDTQEVWLFEADVEMIVFLKMLNEVAAVGDEITYGDAERMTMVTGKLTGASGEHERLDNHGELKSSGAFLNIFYEAEAPIKMENAEIRALTIECWLGMPFGEDMASKFPSVP